MRSYQRYFAVVERAEIEENEFNLNLPRYVDTFEPELVLPLTEARLNLAKAQAGALTAAQDLNNLLAVIDHES
ncbi:hypothetical protein [uncultured Lamprocystis sp.]|uniref:hypothetical protein n=1 Tax=uncultured Lamprocystis sp. TaxID=543132 RepID=UPI0025EE30F1|nr:hypothetical protein [uncultured Lamprocystis sp.]